METRLKGSRHHWFTYNSKFEWGDGKGVLCEVLPKWSDETGMFKVSGVPYDVVYEFRTRQWEVFNTEGKMVLTAHKPSDLQSTIIVQRPNLPGTLRIRTRCKGDIMFEVYEIEEEEDMKDLKNSTGKLKLQLIAHIFSLKFDVVMHDLQLDNDIFSFLCFLFILMIRRRQGECSFLGCLFRLAEWLKSVSDSCVPRAACPK